MNNSERPPIEAPRSLLVPTLGLSAVAVLALDRESGISLASALLAARPAVESACWVFRNDPNRKRGQVCGFFHLTAGIWHGAPSALITLIVLILIQKHLGVVVDADDAKPTLIALFSAIGLSALTGIVVAIAALWTNSRVWVNPRFYQALSIELQTGSNLFSNHGRFILATSLSIPVLALLAGVLMYEFPVNGGAAMLIPLLLVAVPIVLVLLPLFYLSGKIFANGPREYLAAQIPLTADELNTD